MKNSSKFVFQLVSLLAAFSLQGGLLDAELALAAEAASSNAALSNDSQIKAHSAQVGAAVRKSGAARGKRRARKVRRAATSGIASTKLIPLSPRVDSLTTAVKLSDKATLDMLRFGALRHAQGQFDEAETAFRQVLARDSNNVDAFYNLGSLAERRGDLIAALSHYRAAQALKPNDHQIGDAVHSVEKTLRSAPFSNNYLHPSHTSHILNPSRPSYTASSAPVASASLLVEPLAQANQFPDPPAGSDQYPVLSALSAPDPVPSVTGSPDSPGTFQLSSSKNAALAPTLGVVPSSGAALPSPPVLGVKPRSHPIARAALNGALNTGASMGLRAVGLHCPVCHFLRFNF